MTYQFQIAGITFRIKDNVAIASMRPSGECSIEREPDNKFDKNALRVMLEGQHIGYIPSDKAQGGKDEPLVQGIINTLLTAGGKFKVGVDSYCYKDKAGFNNDHMGVLGAITLVLTTDGSEVKKAAPKAAAKPEFVRMKSFNEKGVEVDFYPGPHKYIYNGKRLKSVTQLVSKMYKPFNKAMVAANCEKSWGMPAADIVDMWNINGEAASNFGSALHSLLENYQKYGERALPKMPVLRSIVESFPWDDCKVRTEVLITSVKRGLCGLCDRLTLKGGVYQVCDYKFNVGATDVKSSLKNKVYPGLQATKVGKYVVQTSVYAAMLAESGADVSDEVVAHVWDGEWRHFTEQRIANVLEDVK